MLNIKKTLTKILEALEPPTTIDLQLGAGYYQAFRSDGTGLNMYLVLPIAPKTVTGNNVQLFDTTWKNITVDSFQMRGLLCCIRLTFTGTITPGVYGLKGTISLTY